MHKNLMLRVTVFSCFLLCSVCPAREKLRILVHMVDAQYEYFVKELIPQFESQYNARVTVIRAGSIDEIPAIFTNQEGKLDLVKIPFGKCWSLVNSDKILPLDAFLTQDEIREFEKTYILTRLGAKEGRQYFMPRKYETRMMVYRKSKVRDALAAWETYRDTVQAILKEMNGFGLPRNYTLEQDPSEWDFFDIFVVGAIWSRMAYNNDTKPRIAHRGKKYSGTSLGLIDEVFQCNGDASTVLRMSGNAVIDVFEWESVYACANIYNKRMWTEGWSGEDIWKAFRTEDVFLSFMTQIDCLFLHGRDSLAGYVSDPGDLGVALMPRGCSPRLDKGGRILWMGTKAITTGGWWWAIPKKSSHPKSAYAFFTFITSQGNQLHECMRFGMIPVRHDILKNKSLLFDKGWISEMFRTSYKQIQINDNTVVSSSPHFEDIANLYLDAWYSIVVGGNWSLDKKKPKREYIEDVLKNEYGIKAFRLGRY